MYRLTHSLQARKVDHRINLAVSENLVECSMITAVSLHERHRFADNLLHSLQSLRLRVYKVIYYHYRMSRFIQFYDGMTTDVASTTSK